MEKMKSSLEDLVSKRIKNGESFSTMELKDICKPICEYLLQAEKDESPHENLKPSNVL